MARSRRQFLTLLLIPWLGPSPCDVCQARERPGLLLLEGHRGSVQGCAFAPDGKTLATAGDDGTIRLWDLATGKERLRLSIEWGKFHSVAFSPDGRQLVSSSSDCWIRFWDIAAGKELHQIHGHPVPAPSTRSRIALSADGKLLASQGPDWKTCLWDATTGRRLQRWESPQLNGGAHPDTALALSPNGKVLAAGNPHTRTSLSLLDTATGKTLHKISPGEKGAATVALCFSPDSSTVAAGLELLQDLGGPTKEVHLWDVASGREIRRLDGYAGERHSAPADVVFAADGKVLALSGARHTVRLVQVATGKEVGRLEGHQQPLTCVVFAPDGRLVVASGVDGRTLVWNVAELTGR